MTVIIINIDKMLAIKGVVSPLSTNSGTHPYPESTWLITAIEATGVQLKPETYIEWSIALLNLQPKIIRLCIFPYKKGSLI